VFKICSYENQKNINPEPVPGTCHWVLTHDLYRKWYQNPDSDLLWVSADPGCGKSVLSRKLVDQDLQNSSAYTVCYFFFKDNEDQNNLPNALCSILHQVFASQPRLIKYALSAWNKHGETIRSEREELWRILLGAVSDLESRKVACVFDAIDECREDHRERFISMLSEFYKTIHSNPPKGGSLKILVTSRPYDEIRDGFLKIPSSLPTIHLRGDEMNDRIHHGINLVVHAKVVELAKNLKLPERTKQELEEKLLGMGHRTYLWLYLAIEGIREVYADSLRPEEVSIKLLPTSVEDAYETILGKITSDQRDIAKEILHIVVGARRPLTIGELAEALHVVMEPDRLREKIRRLCGLFVFFNNSRIYLIHQTAKEFLVGSSITRNSKWKHCLHPRETERLMARICIDYLLANGFEKGRANRTHITHGLAHLLEHWPDHFWRGEDDPAIKEYKTKHTLLDYAAKYWISHVQDGDIVDSALITSVRKLCNIGDGTACVWFHMYYKSSSSILEHLSRPERPKPGLYWAVGLGLVCATKSFLDTDTAASYDRDTLVSILLIATKNSNYGAALTALLLDYKEDGIMITQGVVIAAAENGGNGKEVMALLLDRCGTDVQITQEVVVAAARNFNGKEVIALLLDRCGTDVQITQEVVVAAARNGKEVMALLLDRRSADIQITQKVVVAAARNERNGEGIIALLLDRCGADVQITQEVVVAAARNFNGKEVMALLLDRRGADVQITQEVVVTAARNFNGKEVMALLLDRRGADVQITQEVVVAAAGNFNGKEVVALLLDRCGADVQITQEVVVAAAGNGKEVMALLLDRRGADVQITQEVVVTAARNFNGKEVMTLLLDRRSADIQITQEVVVVAASNEESGKEVIALLLDRRVQIMQEAVTAIVQYFDINIVILLLNRYSVDVQITQEVVVAAAGNFNSKEVIALLLDRCGVDVQITQEVVVAAAGNFNGKEVMALLLDRRGADVQITQEVVVAAAGNYFNGKDIMTLLLDRRGADVHITQQVVIAAAGNRLHGKDIITLLLDRRGADVQITEEVVKAAAGNLDVARSFNVSMMPQVSKSQMQSRDSF